MNLFCFSFMKKPAVANPKLCLRNAATFQIMWCFSAKFRLARSPIKVSAT